MINKSIYRFFLHYPQCASHRFLPKSVLNLIFYQNLSLILDHLRAVWINPPCLILSHVDLIQPPSTTRCSTHWWEKIEAGARQLAGLWKDPEKYIDLVIHRSLTTVSYKGLQLIWLYTDLLQKHDYASNYFDLNRVAIHWNAFCPVKNCCNDLTHPASEAGCYVAAWLAFVYQYSEGGLVSKF